MVLPLKSSFTILQCEEDATSTDLFDLAILDTIERQYPIERPSDLVRYEISGSSVVTLANKEPYADLLI